MTPPPPPEVLSQAYAVPTSFVTMTTTQTRRGITAKSILGMSLVHDSITCTPHVCHMYITCTTCTPHVIPMHVVGLMSGHIAAIPKTVLDPRREVEPSDEMK